ncbi:hypothetical protein LXL04_022381 [Taraxacum kok-saghyz]
MSQSNYNRTIASSPEGSILSEEPKQKYALDVINQAKSNIIRNSDFHGSESINVLHESECSDDDDERNQYESNSEDGSNPPRNTETTINSHEDSSSSRETFWIPEVPKEMIPVESSKFKTEAEIQKMYKTYAEEGGFDVHKTTTRKSKQGIVKYIVCNRQGKPNARPYDSSTDKKRKERRQSSMFRRECTACIKYRICNDSTIELYVFNEEHNHALVNKANRNLVMQNRQINLYDMHFINNMATTNVGPVKAFRLMTSIRGGYELGGANENDYKNFNRDMNSHIKGSDAHLVVTKLENRFEHVENFSFEHSSTKDHLDGMFWADETAKINYKEFGDVVSFDATFRTNKYRMVFGPFTGVDNHRRCVSFGVGLLCHEDEESYVWLLQRFLNAFGKQPTLVLTDQDGAMKNAIARVFPMSKHRLCMWHITQKLPVKVASEFPNYDTFKQRFSDIIWDSSIDIEEFEQRWGALFKDYKMTDNNWFKDMYKIRERWIPAYFKHIPMSGLMRTTSRSESQNSTFNQATHFGSPLVYFMMSYEMLMERQRHKQNVNDHKDRVTTVRIETDLLIEEHAREIYTRELFLKVQKEIKLSIYACFPINSIIEEGVEISTLVETNKSKRSAPVEILNEDGEKELDWNIPRTTSTYTVTFNKDENSAECDCFYFQHYGTLCRHVFCIFRKHNVTRIPSKYILRRWLKDLIPTEQLKKKFARGDWTDETNVAANDMFRILYECISKVNNDPIKLEEIHNQMKEMNKNLDEECNEPMNKVDVLKTFLGVTSEQVVKIKNPILAKTKGSGTHSRIKSAKEKAQIQATKVQRRCGKCHQAAPHNARTCNQY